jgi:hypothetical protein
MTDKISQQPVLPLDPPERFAGGAWRLRGRRLLAAS